MRIETYSRGKFQVLRIQEDTDNIQDLSELQDLIKGYLNRGRNYIAVSFCDASYIYSGAIRALISCHKMIEEKKGSLCILEPDPGLFDVLETLNIGRVINIYVSEEFLPE